MLVVLGALFVALSALAWHGHVSAIDRTLTIDAVQQPGSIGFRAAKVISVAGSSAVVAVLSLMFGTLLWRRTKSVLQAVIVPLAGAIGGVTELLAKQLVGRLRPPTASFTGESGYGFPSGHTTGFTAAAFAVVLVLGMMMRRPNLGRHGIVALVSSVLIGLSRVLVGAHYVFDVLAGLALGTLCATAAVWLAHVVVPPILKLVGRSFPGLHRHLST